MFKLLSALTFSVYLYSGPALADPPLIDYLNQQSTDFKFFHFKKLFTKDESFNLGLVFATELYEKQKFRGEVLNDAMKKIALGFSKSKRPDLLLDKIYDVNGLIGMNFALDVLSGNIDLLDNMSGRDLKGLLIKVGMHLKQLNYENNGYKEMLKEILLTLKANELNPVLLDEVLGQKIYEISKKKARNFFNEHHILNSSEAFAAYREVTSKKGFTYTERVFSQIYYYLFVGYVGRGQRAFTKYIFRAAGYLSHLPELSLELVFGILDPDKRFLKDDSIIETTKSIKARLKADLLLSPEKFIYYTTEYLKEFFKVTLDRSIEEISKAVESSRESELLNLLQGPLVYKFKKLLYSGVEIDRVKKEVWLSYLEEIQLPLMLKKALGPNLLDGRFKRDVLENSKIIEWVESMAKLMYEVDVPVYSSIEFLRESQVKYDTNMLSALARSSNGNLDRFIDVVTSDVEAAFFLIYEYSRSLKLLSQKLNLETRLRLNSLEIEGTLMYFIFPQLKDLNQLQDLTQISIEAFFNELDRESPKVNPIYSSFQILRLAILGSIAIPFEKLERRKEFARIAVEVGRMKNHEDLSFHQMSQAKRAFESLGVDSELASELVFVINDPNHEPKRYAKPRNQPLNVVIPFRQKNGQGKLCQKLFKTGSN